MNSNKKLFANEESLVNKQNIYKININLCSLEFLKIWTLNQLFLTLKSF